jgi:nucleoside-triphosphatase THEP1
MKHILNNLSDEEKNSIREQHTGGMKVMTENFSKLLNSKLGDSKPLVSEQSSDSKQEYINLKKKLQKKYPEICKYDTINKSKDGSSKIKLNTGGKIYPFDSEVKRYQELYNKLSSNKIKVDGIIGPEMKKLFCTLS